jgi:uncharacterized protein
MAFFDTVTTSPKPSPGSRPRVAIVGSGIAGLAAAHHLHGHAEITMLESGDYFGGHTHTVDMRLPNAEGQMIDFGVDTGFLVLNERTYPNLLALFKDLGVEIAPSDMSFSVQVPEQAGQRRIEWSGSNLSTVFAQRRNLISPQFWGMLSDIVRFNRLCTDMAQQGLDRTDGPLMEPLGDFLKRESFGEAFKHWYFLPMMGCIWSCPTDQMLAFPVATMVRFCHNHGLIQIANRPQWYTVRGGARHYVDAITARIDDKRLNSPVLSVVRDADGALVRTDAGTERFDHVVLACHSDQALALLGEGASAAERAVLGAIPYQSNVAILHTDTSVLPQHRSAWAAWNYERAANAAQEQAQVCLHYWLNVLQPLPVEQPVVVSLNPQREIDERHVVGRYEYAHPVFDLGAIRAQTQVPGLQGQQRTHFCGAWMGYGFHEDGLKAGMAAAESVRQALGVSA